MSAKILIVVTHPDMENSKVHKRWIAELGKFPDKYVVHNLHAVYPDARIDVEREQRLLESHDTIVFQFPIFWFNCPPLFKTWLDEVLTEGWAFGEQGNFKLMGKKISFAVSAGISEEGYQPEGRYKYTMNQLLAPFQLTVEYVRADYRPPFILYGLEFQGTAGRIEQSAVEYRDYLDLLGT